MQDWGWKGKQRPPRRPPMTRREIEEAKTRKHIERGTSRALVAKEKAARARADEEMERWATLASAPGGANDTDWEALRERDRNLSDAIAQTDTVEAAVNQAGKVGVFLGAKQQKSEGLFRQFLSTWAILVGKAVDTNRVSRTRAK